MRFLKGLVARKTNPTDDASHSGLAQDESDYVVEQWHGDEAQSVDDYPDTADDSVYRETLDSPVFARFEPEAVSDSDVLETSDRSVMARSQDQANNTFDKEEAVNIWDMFDEDDPVAEEPVAVEPVAEDREPAQEPVASDRDLAREAIKGFVGAPPPEAEPMQRAGRMKTRMLGFHSSDKAERNVFERDDAKTEHGYDRFPVGWIVLIDGPGRGASFTLQYGVSNIGRGVGQTVRLDFGDASISRENHAAIAYDDDLNAFFLGHGGKSNLVRLNGRPVLSTEELSNADLIRIGETTLRFVALCSAEFAWDLTDDQEVRHARAG